MKVSGSLLVKQFNKIYGENPQDFYFSFHSCSICGYKCAYSVANGKLIYDNGCTCTYGFSGYHQTNWSEIANLYNMQSHPDSSIKKQIEDLFKLKEIAGD